MEIQDRLQEILGKIESLDLRLKFLEFNFYNNLSYYLDSELYEIDMDIVHNPSDPESTLFVAIVHFKGYEDAIIKTFEDNRAGTVWTKALNLIKNLDLAAKNLSDSGIKAELVHRPQEDKPRIRLNIGNLNYYLTKNTTFEVFKRRNLTQLQEKAIKDYLEATKKRFGTRLKLDKLVKIA